MQNGPVPHGHVVAYDARKVVRHVTNAVVLDVCVVTDHHAIDVAAQNAVEPNAGIFADLHIADQPRPFSHKDACAKLGTLAEIFEEAAHHGNSGVRRCKMQSRFGRIQAVPMNGPTLTPPHWIVIRLDEDMNWWLDETSDDMDRSSRDRSILDPRQVSHLVEALDQYRPHGLRPEQFAAAFQVYAMQSELSDGRLKLILTDESIIDTGAQLFALPLIGEEDAGAYSKFVDTISAARVRLLNKTHHYARDCTELDMLEELDALDRDRFFSAETMHVFDEINEILEWSPAEWEDSES